MTDRRQLGIAIKEISDKRVAKVIGNKFRASASSKELAKKRIAHSISMRFKEYE